MLGVALELRRPAHVVFGQQRAWPKPPCGIAVAKNSGRPGMTSSGWRTYGTMLLFGLPRAGADAGQRERRAHQLQELAAAGRIGELGGLRRELALRRTRGTPACRPVLRGCASTCGLRGRPVASGCRRGSSCLRRDRSEHGRHAPLAVAHRAAGHVLDAGHVVFLLQPAVPSSSWFAPVGLVGHVEDLVARPEDTSPARDGSRGTTPSGATAPGTSAASCRRGRGRSRSRRPVSRGFGG